MPDAPTDLLTRDAATAYREAMRLAAETVAAHLATTGPRTSATADDLAPAIEAVDLDHTAGDLGAAMEEVSALYLRDAVWYHDPGYLAHLNCPVLVPAIAAEAILSAVNTSMDTWDQSTGATLIERRLVQWIADRLGLSPTPDGIFTSGGTQSNLHGLLLARGRAREAGIDSARLRVLATDQSHFSIGTALDLLGLGADAVVTVPTDASGRMDPVALDASLDALSAHGLAAMAVVATAGTTDLGVIDPLRAIGDAAHRHGAWFHVDAAYGGGLVMSQRHRHLLAGIESADSVTVDLHKTAFQPVSSSVLLVADETQMRHVRHHADYLNPRGCDLPNQVDKSLQTTRRFDALKLWMTLRTTGADAIGEMLDTLLDLASDVADHLDARPDIELAARPELSTVVFRWAPPGTPEATVDALTPRLRRALFDDGRVLIAGTRIGGRAWLKFTLLNPTTSLREVLRCVDHVAEVGARLLADGVEATDAPTLAEVTR